MEPKFKVGDVVRHKFERKNRWMVLEVHTVTCYGGTQVMYTCRGGMRETMRYGLEGVTKDMFKFFEIELEAIQDNSAALKELQLAHTKLTLEKEEFIKTQDFEKAALKSNEARDIKDKINELE